VIVLSSAAPVRTFQDFSTLDLVSAGRAELLVGRGSFIESFPLFGQSLDDYNELFAEKLDLLVQIRDNERVTWNGRFRPPLDDRPIYPRPHQDSLPIWVGVGGTPASIVRAARLGLPVALAIIGGEPARFRVLADLYRKTLAESGFDPEQVPLAVHGLGYIAETNEEAADTVYTSFTAMMNRIGRERGWTPMTREQFDWMRGPDGSLVLGDPETVAAKVLRWKEILGVNRFMLHTAGAVSHDNALRSIELLGTDVSRIVRGR
jgi:alkanesulfonate monooxygenase SsuD/methylene tetrahydromethanopterin reductase-like flavin-dependent oxidoreductase (luciferase family)